MVDFTLYSACMRAKVVGGSESQRWSLAPAYSLWEHPQPHDALIGQSVEHRGCCPFDASRNARRLRPASNNVRRTSRGTNAGIRRAEKE